MLNDVLVSTYDSFDMIKTNYMLNFDHIFEFNHQKPKQKTVSVPDLMIDYVS